MKLIKRARLVAFWEKHPDVETRLTAWYQMVRAARWANAEDVKAAWARVSVLRDNRFVFDIRGNHYRLVAVVNFRRQIVFGRFVGTHADYDRIDANEI